MTKCAWKSCKTTANQWGRRGPKLCKKHYDLYRQGKRPGRPTKKWKTSQKKSARYCGAPILRGSQRCLKKTCRKHVVRSNPAPKKRKIAKKAIKAKARARAKAKKKGQRPAWAVRKGISSRDWKKGLRRQKEAREKRGYCEAKTESRWRKRCSRKWTVQGWVKIGYLQRGLYKTWWRRTHYCTQHAKQQSKLRKFRKTKPR